MLDDRSYMRESSEGYRSAAMTLFWVIIGAFLLQQIDLFYNDGRMRQFLALSPGGIKSGFVWQFFTFQFLHAGILHLLFNLLGLWSFGKGLEQVLGTKRFLIAYFGSGVLGGVLQVLLGFVGPQIWGGDTVGASAGICGMIAVYAMLEPHSTVSVWGIPMRARALMIGLAFISLFFIVVPVGGAAHGAHLGGILAGIAFVKWFFNTDWSMPRFQFRKAPRSRELVNAPAGGGFWKKAPKSLPPEEDLPSGDYISKEVDPILDKISAHGIQSLTERERRILEAARAKMAKR